MTLMRRLKIKLHHYLFLMREGKREKKRNREREIEKERDGNIMIN